MTRKQTSLLSFLAIVALILAFLITQRAWFRLDLTKNKAYTLSEVSRNLHTEITDRINITYYVSDRLTQLYPAPGEIEDLIREYVAHSRGKIRFTRQDPAKAGLGATVEQLGILPQQIQVVEEDQASIATVYSGILIEYLDDVEVLPFVFSLNTLEYDLSSRIRSLVRGSEREIGVILGDANRSWANDYGYLNHALVQSAYRVRQFIPGDEIPDTLPVLMVIGGTEELDDWALYRIDRYIQMGGKVLFMAEAVHVDDRNNLEARTMTDRGLLAMVSFYGATVQPELVLDVNSLTLPFQTVNSYGSMQFRLIRYPFWVSVPAQGGNLEHPLTAAFNGADLFWASPISLNPPEGISAEGLFSSSAESWRMTRDFSANPAIEYLFYGEQAETEGSQVLAAALSGRFESWFKGMPKPVREGSGEELPDLPAESAESRIVVIGDADMGSVLIQYSRSERNLDFLLQAADWLGNDDDIIGIRNRAPQAGRLDKISDPEKRLGAMHVARTLNVFIIPLALIIFGIIRSVGRKKSAGRKEGGDGI